MSNLYKASGSTLFIGKIMHDMKKMKAELKEHRYCLERNVELRTGHLLTRIALLESCNETLCAKLELARPGSVKTAETGAAKLYVMDKSVNLQDKWQTAAAA